MELEGRACRGLLRVKKVSHESADRPRYAATLPSSRVFISDFSFESCRRRRRCVARRGEAQYVRSPGKLIVQLAGAFSDRGRLPTLPLSQYHRRGGV